MKSEMSGRWGGICTAIICSQQLSHDEEAQDDDAVAADADPGRGRPSPGITTPIAAGTDGVCDEMRRE